MKKQTKTALGIIILSVVVLLTVGFLVVFHFYPDGVKYWLHTCWEWINEPLPVVGVSALFIILGAWKIISTTTIGKKNIAKLKAEFERTKETYKETVAVVDQLIDKVDTLESRLKRQDEIIFRLLELIPNKKIKELGDEFYGEETKEEANNEARTD